MDRNPLALLFRRQTLCTLMLDYWINFCTSDAGRLGKLKSLGHIIPETCKAIYETLAPQYLKVRNYSLTYDDDDDYDDDDGENFDFGYE
ncbi:hypothetical protein RRG08_041662 [Elysia crispata]|uniref:Uncharacterized protein n=1 Tax=Elysia crispata TaxID=231223 RepID=A0AAE0YCN6_9GAST|nr:hypothetical protein RRG08_041662 [Elysia crispata]